MGDSKVISEPSAPHGAPAAADPASWSAANLPNVQDLPALGLVGPGQFAELEEIEAVRNAGVGICRRTGVLVCLVGSPRLAVRRSEDVAGPKAIGSGLSKRVWRQSATQITRKEVNEAKEKALVIASRLPDEVKLEQLALLSAETGGADGHSLPSKVAPLLWAEPAHMRFACGLCPSTTATRKAFLKHVCSQHKLPSLEGANGELKLLQAVFFGCSTGYVHVRATGLEVGQPIQASDPASAQGLTSEQREVFTSLTACATAAEVVAGDSAKHGEDGIEDGTTFLFRSGLAHAIKRLGLSPEAAYTAAKEKSVKRQADGVMLSPIFLLEKAVVAACVESFASFKSANPDLKAACVWKAQGSACDDAADASRSKADVKAMTTGRYTRVIARLVSFIARMITKSGDGSVAPQVREAGWVEDHNAVFVSVGFLFCRCQEQSLEAQTSEEQASESCPPCPENLRLAHGVLFELLVKPVSLVRKSVSPLLAFLAASAASRKYGEAGPASARGSDEYSWNPWSSGITPLTAAIIKMATAVSVHHVLDSALLPDSPEERVMQVQRFRQAAHLDAATAPVAEVAVVMSVGRRVLAAEHGAPSVIPCGNRAHSLCAFIGNVELPLSSIGSAAKEAEKSFWNSFKDSLLPNEEAGMPDGLDTAWLAAPATGVDTLEETIMPWMVSMGNDQERLALEAHAWVTAMAVGKLDIAAEVGADDVGRLVAQNKKGLARVRKALMRCARALMVLCTLGTGAPLRATETGCINLRGGKGVVRDLFFLEGGFFIIHHETKASHNFATAGEPQPRKLPAQTSAAVAAWCRMCLPLRDLLLQCGETVLGLSPANHSHSDPNPRLFGGSDGSADRLNTGLDESGLALTLSPYRQYSAFMLRMVTHAGGNVDGQDEDAGIAVLAAAAERQFGHSEKTGAAFYGRIPTASKIARLLPAYAAVSTLWHEATGQAAAAAPGMHAGNAGQGGDADGFHTAAGVECPPRGRKRAPHSSAGQELCIASAQRRRVTVDVAPEKPAVPPPAPSGALPQASSLAFPSPLQLRIAAAAIVGLPSFRFSWATKQQEDAAQYVAAGMPDGDALLVLATGGGKFVTYAASSITDPARLTVVIVPFVALAQDLERRFGESGLRVARFGRLSPPTLLAGCPDFEVVIAGLESVLTDNWTLLFSGAFASGRKTFLVVEECHVLHFDRYRQVCGQFAGAVRRFAVSGLCPAPPMLLVTATAPPSCAAEIFAACGSDAHMASTRFRTPCTIRRNVRLTVTRASSELTAGGAELKAWITRQVLSTLGMRVARHEPTEDNPEGAIGTGTRLVLLVFVETRAMTAEVTASLQGTFASVLPYHAKLSEGDKMAAFQTLTCPVEQHASLDAGLPTGDAARLRQVTAVVATVAFGVGLDIRNVCTVCIVGHRAPSSLITYAQMAGRAGRDGLPSLCATLLHHGAPTTSFGGLPAAGGSTDSAGVQEGLRAASSGGHADGLRPNGDFGRYCLDDMCCRQTRLHRFLDGDIDGGQLGEHGAELQCQSLAARFFSGQQFQFCDVCAPGNIAEPLEGLDGEELYSTDDEDADVTSQVTDTIAGGLPLEIATDDTPQPLSDPRDGLLAELVAICNSAPSASPHSGPVCNSTGLEPTGVPQVASTSAVFSHAAGMAMNVTARAPTPMPDIVAKDIATAIAASGQTRSAMLGKVIDEAKALCETFRRSGVAHDTCSLCISALMVGAFAIDSDKPRAKGFAGGVMGGRGLCDHAREGCLTCSQNWRHINGATNSRAEHSFSSPDCPLSAAREASGRCRFCWMSTVYGMRHKWGRECPFGPLRNAALRMFWDSKASVAAFVADEEKRTGKASGRGARISSCIASFSQFLTRDDEKYGPPLAQLITSAYNALK